MRERIYKVSLFSLILAAFAAVPVDAAIRVKGATRNNYSDAYNQLTSYSYQQEVVPVTAQDLPVTVEDSDLADAILNSSSETSVDDL